MKANFLKIAGVNSEAEFYQMFPSEEAFFAAHPEAQMMRDGGSTYSAGVWFSQGGEMIKRADGSYSKRGLWDNIRANKGSGKKPTAEMLKQERKIRANEKAYGGDIINPDLAWQSGGEPMRFLPDGYVNPDWVRQSQSMEADRTGDAMVISKAGQKLMEDKLAVQRQQEAFARANPGIDRETLRKQLINKYGTMKDGDFIPNEAYFKARGRYVPTEANPADSYVKNYTKGYKKGGSTYSGGVWYQNGGQEDSTLENIAEVFDPTGITSWDDVYRSYKETGMSPQTALEVLGAIPLLGKAGKAAKTGIHLAKYKGLEKFLYNALPKSKVLSKGLEGAGLTGRASDAVQAVIQAPGNNFFPEFSEGGIPMMQTAGATPDDDSWIRKMLQFEATKGSATGTGLSNWGYNSRNPRTIDEAIEFYKQDFLPKVQQYPMGMRERAGDFLYNTGEDARLYQLDQYVRKYENMPNGLPDRGQYRSSGTKAGEFGNLYGQYQAKIDALPMEERIKLMDQGRDYYYKNINTVNGQPSAAYNATWKPRVNMWGAYKAPQPVQQAQPVQQTQVAQPTTQTVEQPRTPYQIQTAQNLQVKQQPVTGYALPNITALPGTPAIGPTAAATTNAPVANTQSPQPATTATVATPKIGSSMWQTDISDAEMEAQAAADMSTFNTNTSANANAVIGQQVQQQVKKDNPALNLNKKPTFNGMMGSIQDKLMDQYTNPFSMTNVANYAGNFIDGINNKNNMRDAQDKQRQDYSTDYAYMPTVNNAMSRGQYDMYGQMVPDKIGGNLSFTGMNQKYSAGVPRFAEGGLSDFDYIADIATPAVSIDPMAGLRNYGSPTVAPADATRVAAPVAIPADFEPISSDKEDIRNIIGKKESQNDYGALPRMKGGRLASSAVGKYQFLWGDHKNTIKQITGIDSKEAFRQNPQAQEKFFDYWNNNILTPVANEIASRFKPNMSMNDIKQIIHFQGPAGAKKYFATGKYTTDKFGSNPVSYLQKKYAEGGEIEVSEEELAQILKMGGQVEYC